MNQTMQEQPAAKAQGHPEYSPGLEGVIAGESAICQVDEGEAGLRYRGYAIGDLAGRSSFEEVAYLLLFGHLPRITELEEFSQLLVRNRRLPEQVQHFLESLRPGMHPMDVLRTGVSLLGLTDPEAQDGSREANLRKSVRLLAHLPQLIAAGYQVMAGRPPATPDSHGNFAENLLSLVAGRRYGDIGAAMADALNAAQFGGVNFVCGFDQTRARTFFARSVYKLVTVSTMPSAEIGRAHV